VHLRLVPDSQAGAARKLEQGQPHLLNRQGQGLEVLDLCFDFGEVRRGFPFVDSGVLAMRRRIDFDDRGISIINMTDKAGWAMFPL
jgi:hypothetical protein